MIKKKKNENIIIKGTVKVQEKNTNKNALIREKITLEIKNTFLCVYKLFENFKDNLNTNNVIRKVLIKDIKNKLILCILNNLHANII